MTDHSRCHPPAGPGPPYLPLPGAARRPTKTGRTQYRRQDWEDDPDPLVSWPTVTAIPPGPDKVAVFAARHARREKLWDAGDALAKPADVADAVADVMKAHASGIEFLGDTSAAHVRPWRVHPWDGEEKRHVSVGYFATWEEALLAVRLWHAACGTTNDDSINCAKWSPPDRLKERAETMTIDDIVRAARDGKQFRGMLRAGTRAGSSLGANLSAMTARGSGPRPK